MPFSNESFNVVMCGLATHHMNVPRMLSEIRRVLKSGGRISLADAGGSSLWRLSVIKFIIRMAAFLYFLAVENISRAWAEAAGRKRAMTEKNFALLYEMEAIALLHKVFVAQAALEWILADPVITSPIIRATSVEQPNEVSAL